VVIAAVMAMVASAAAMSAPTTAATRPIEYGIDGWARVSNDPLPGAQANALRNLHTLGVNWIRLDVNWGDVEQTRGTRVWAPIDRVVNAAVASHIKVLAVVQRTPTWARPAGSGESYPSTTPAELTLYSAFVRIFAQRYTRPGAIHVQAVEIWNEPNVPGAWQGPKTGPRYVNLLRTAYKAIKAVNPYTTVVTGGLAPAFDSATSVNARTFLINLYKAGGRPYFNAVGMHPYTWPNKPSDNSVRGWGNMTLPDQGKPSMRSTMTKYGDAAKKIWNTEFGSPASKVGEAKQAAIAKDAVHVWNTYSWAGPFFYMSYQDMRDTPWEGMGLIRKDYTRRPVFTAFKNAITLARGG
jgi:hypothetical protein